MKAEVWRDVVGYEGMYLVSNKGNVISIPRFVEGHYTEYLIEGKTLKKKIDKKGYERVYLSVHNEDKWIPVHRIVAKAFIPNKMNKPQVNHKDGNKLNNNVENLEWCTNGENQKHAYAMGLNKVTGRAGRKKVPVIMIDLKTRKELGTYESITAASKQTGVCAENIKKVLKGERSHAGGYWWKRGDA